MGKNKLAAIRIALADIVFTEVLRFSDWRFQSKSYFFRLIPFFNVVSYCHSQLNWCARGYETEESFHGRKGTISADGLLFPFRFRSMAWREFLVLRWRGSIALPEFLQFRTRIPDRSGARTGEGDGSVCVDCPDLGVAGALHGCNGGEIVEQRPPAVVSSLHPHPRRVYCCLGQRISSRYSGVSSGTRPSRLVFSVTTRGIRNCRR